MTASASHRLGAVELLRRFARSRGDDDFARELALRCVATLPVAAGDRVLDLGAGPGHYSHALEQWGAVALALDLDVDTLTASGDPADRTLAADGRRLPFPDAAFDGVLCSNMLEHTPDAFAVLDEIARVTRPGGWAYVSWTNWYSPWGGHAIAPFHYLGAERGLRVYRRLRGEPRGKNLPYDGVWPVHIGPVLRYLRAHSAFTIESVEPRYYPRLRLIMRVPGAREVLAWNGVFRLRRR